MSASPGRMATTVFAAVVFIATVSSCSGSSSSAVSTTTTAPAAIASCKFEYQAAASRLNGVARYFSQAAQDGQMNEQFAGFAANYVDAMKAFDITVSALDCPAEVSAELAGLVAAQVQLEPLVAQFAAGERPPVPAFNAAAQAVAEAVRRVNTTLGIS